MGDQLFPDDPRPVYVYSGDQEFDTGIVSFRGGPEQRRTMQKYPRYNYTLLYGLMSHADFQTFWNFYRTHYGAGESFFYWDQKSRFFETSYLEQFIAYGDGVLDTFDIPGKLGVSDSITVYLESTELVRDTDYSVLTGSGAGGADQIQILTGPVVTGGLLTCDFAGRLRVRVRFAEDEMSYSWFAASLFEYGLELRGLLPNA